MNFIIKIFKHLVTFVLHHSSLECFAFELTSIGMKHKDKIGNQISIRKQRYVSAAFIVFHWVLYEQSTEETKVLSFYALQKGGMQT